MVELVTVVEFNYNQLDVDVLNALLDQENLLEAVLKRSHKEIGEILIRIKDILPHGMYEKWHRSKGISDDMASRCVRIAKGIEVKSRKMLLLPETTSTNVDHEDSGTSNVLDEEHDLEHLSATDLFVEAQQLKVEKATLQTQLQDALQQKTQPTKQHHNSGGNHNGPPTSTKDGVTRQLVNYDHWETTAITVSTGYACQNIQTGVRDDLDDANYRLVYFQNKGEHHTARIRVHAIDKDVLARDLERLAQELRK